ncbi:Predicted phage phi-C31 gp36 major capsid-like protein [Nocardia otitidiscaviarum]|uniref:Predicted phage phi-C31 gp36 major capsid-like protein n=1 Tax=Nocardia otitidiscaviarum TaxID=1823 RepID=A0A378YEU3_9NOCA|nr:phage major capsid protein [Nocardia otitidiscaviarum]SUA75388.1 Predicted phage phi-C31 gp36 major capsid-like protein [Nocardia otitidiscaviarum]
MPFTTVSGAAILNPAQIEASLVKPLESLAAIALCSTIVRTPGASALRIPVTAATPTASFVAEGAEIPVTDADLDELILTPQKLAGLSVITSELAQSSTPQAADIVGGGLAKDIAKKLDMGAFGSLPAPAPAGLAALSGVQAVTAHVSGGKLTDFDWAAEAESLSVLAGGDITHWVAAPDAALLVATTPLGGVGGLMPALQPDPTLPTRRQVLGRPLIVSPAVAPRTIWGIDNTRSFLAIAEEVTLETDRSVYFTSDRIAIRAKLRVSYGWPEPATVVKITIPE